jgi:HlyD family secretion protein
MRVNTNAIATLIAGAIIVAAGLYRPEAPQAQGSATPAQATPAQATPDPATGAVPARAPWAASATGRVEPRTGQIVVATPVAGRVADVAVAVNDRVKAGDLLARLDEEDLVTRVTAAAVEVQVREREREEEVARGLALERRQAEDSVAAAERALYRARLTLDDLMFRARTSEPGNTTRAAPADIAQARFQVAAAREQLANSRASLDRVLAKDGLPLATRLEASLANARGELSLAEAAVERARIRAPIDGTILGVYVTYGELAAPSPDAPMFVLGDVSSLRVRAEVEERDIARIKVGQAAIVKGDAFPDREFTGVVTSVAQAMAAPRIPPRGIRRPTDVEVIEVLVALDGAPPLLSGMRVDVFFKADAAPAATPGATPGSSGLAGSGQTSATAVSGLARPTVN